MHLQQYNIKSKKDREFKVREFHKVVKTGSVRSVQSEKPGTSPGTGPVESKKPGSVKNRDKTGHPPVEPVTRPTRCRVIWFLLFCLSFDHVAPFMKKLYNFLTFYFIDFF